MFYLFIDIPVGNRHNALLFWGQIYCCGTQTPSDVGNEKTTTGGSLAGAV